MHGSSTARRRDQPRKFLKMQLHLFHPNACRKHSFEHIEKRMLAQRGRPKPQHVVECLRVARLGKEPSNKIRFTSDQDAAICRMYNDEKLTIGEVAKRIGCSATAMTRRMKELRIKRRTKSEFCVLRDQKSEVREQRRISGAKGRANRVYKTIETMSIEERAARSRAQSNALLKNPGLHKWCKQGHYWSSKLQRQLFYRSGYERQYMEKLDANENVAWYEYEPRSVSVTYEFEGQKKIYRPDFLVQYVDGTKRLIEIKSTWTVTFERTKAKLEALRVLSQLGRLPFPCDIIVGSGHEMVVKDVITF